SVYGENCMAADGSVVSFSALETDIYITVSVPNLQNRSDLGDRIYSLAHVLYGIDYGQFGPTGLPGAKVGYWGVTFQQGDQMVRLWAPEPTIGIYIANGLRGAALLDALQNH
ncbi:MAG TPA: hypothetical protein VMC62_04310, partial [Longilinea sp.]|nr:hypothetical protein [Longilinea sp.]